MVHVTYYKTAHRLIVKGHANSGENGHDLVCASVSTLVYTLTANVEALIEEGYAKEPCIRLREGDAIIACKATPKRKAVIQLIFSAVCAGFLVLATDYPEYITYEVK